MFMKFLYVSNLLKDNVFDIHAEMPETDTDSILIHCSLNSIKKRLFWDYGTRVEN